MQGKWDKGPLDRREWRRITHTGHPSNGNKAIEGEENVRLKKGFIF